MWNLLIEIVRSLFVISGDVTLQPDTQSTKLPIWHLSECLECLVYEPPGEEETPSHSVSLPLSSSVLLSLLLSFSLSALQTWLSDSCVLFSLLVSPPAPVSLSQQRLLIAAIRPLCPALLPLLLRYILLQTNSPLLYLLTYVTRYSILYYI